MSHSPLVIRYLAELDAALKLRNVPDRDAVLVGISEHIDEALSMFANPTEADVAAVLSQLGDPLRIANESSQGPAGSAVSAPVFMTPSVQYFYERRRPPIMCRDWVAPLAAILYVVALFLSCGAFVFLAFSAGMGGHALTVLPFNPFWIGSVVIVTISPLFRTWEKLVWALSIPAVLLVLAIFQTGNLVNSSHAGDAVFGSVVTFGLPLGALIWGIRLTVQVARRSKSWQAGPHQIPGGHIG